MTPDEWDGLRLQSAGTGPGVLWIHGYTMRSDIWAPAWRELPGWTHIGVDLPWHGASRAARPDETLASLADSLVALASDRGVRHVVALSFGTIVAAEMAIRAPETLGSLVLSSPSLAGMSHGPAVEARYRELARLFAERGPGPPMTRLWMSSPPEIVAGVERRPEALGWVRPIIDRHPWRELADGGMRRFVEHPQRAADMASVPSRVAILVGERDLLAHRACARSIGSVVAQAEVVEVAGCGHLAPLEDPAGFAALARGVLEEPFTR